VHASTSCCRDPSGDGVDSVQQKLSVGIGNAHLVDEERKVVAARSLAGSTMVSRNLVLLPDNVVAGKLSEPREGEVDHGAVTLRSGLDEIADVKEVLVGEQLGFLKRLDDFFHFELDDGMVRIPCRQGLSTCSKV